MKGELVVARDPQSLAQAAAEFILDEMGKARGMFRFVLSGGSSPRALYTLLGMDPRLPWERLALYWGDERFVPPDHADSNLRLVRETLLAQGGVPGACHPIPSDGTPQDAAARYEMLLKQDYGAAELSVDHPLFDLVLLGLGADGHIASLFPGAPVLEERAAWVAGVPRDGGTARVSLTFPALESAHLVMFLVSGAQKAGVLGRGRAGDAALPAGRLCPQGRLVWFADRAAAGG